MEPITTGEASTASASASGYGDPGGTAGSASAAEPGEMIASPTAKKSRTNTPWTPAEERRLKDMRDAGNSWNEIAKVGIETDSGSQELMFYTDFPYADGGECQKTLVQGRTSLYRICFVRG